MKTCSTCSRELELTEFSADKRASDGKQSRCKSCCKEAQKERYHQNTDKARERQRNYYANNRDRVLATNKKSNLKNKAARDKYKKDWYEKNKNTSDFKAKQKEYTDSRKEAKREYDKKYREKNKDKLTEIRKIWVSENKEKVRAIKHNYKARRRAQEKEGDSTKEIFDWLKEQEMVCYWCNCDCEDDYHIDHYEPLAKGGAHTTDNMVISCPSCNVKKNAKDPFEFANQVGRLF